MSKNLSHFSLGLNVPFIGPNSRSFRPPSWPPPKEWVCIEDKYGNAVSRYGDHIWDLSTWHGRVMNLDFGDGPKTHTRSIVIDPTNAELLRQLVVWRVWGPRGIQTVNSLLYFATPIRQIIQICSRNNILASELSRYPAVIDLVAQTLSPSTYDKIVSELERLRDACDFLGFELLDAAGIQRLKAAQPVHNTEQTEYIPPRIWNYVVKRGAECINDYLAHQEQIEACFTFCIRAYEKNSVVKYRGKFTDHGSFADTAQHFGIKDVLERWSGSINNVRAFTKYFQTVRYAALVDIAAFTLMRIDEAASVRWNSLTWHDDPMFGRIPLIQAETTKTDPDDKGLWITSPSVEAAISTLKSITKMRLDCHGKWSEQDNPRLITPTCEPWSSGRHSAKKLGLKANLFTLGDVVKKYPLLFNLQQLTITEDDFKIAKAVCPTLNAEQFQVGKPWKLAWHQFRRTGAVNMFASGEISDSSIQLQMKHLTRWQPLYYGRGNTALHLNDSARVLLVNAQYEAMGRQLAEVHTDRFVSPYGNQHKSKLLATANEGQPVNLISEGDAEHYEKAARKQLINFRLTVLGGCMKNGHCEGDSVSSVGDCAGGNGGAPCINVLFDRTRADANQRRIESVIGQLEITPPDTPRYRFLQQEKRGLENYFAYIGKAA